MENVPWIAVAVAITTKCIYSYLNNKEKSSKDNNENKEVKDD